MAGENIGEPVAATDGDGDSLTYTLGETDGGAFDIVATSGQLRTKGALDYETKSSYSVTVSVRDSKDADGNADTATDATVTVTVTVTDVEEPGALELSSTQPVVDESLTTSLTDPDGSGFRSHMGLGEFQGWEQLVGGQRGNRGQLHSGCRRRGELPEGHSVLYRRRGIREDRPGGVGQHSGGGATGEQGPGVSVQRDR